VHVPAPARSEAVMANSGGSRADQPTRGRADITGLAAPSPTPPAAPPAAPTPPRRADAPTLSPATPQGGGSPRGGWLSDLLTRASQQETEPPPREPTGRETPDPTRAGRHTMEALDPIAGHIARLSDPEAAAELWDRYKRGERNVFTRKLYTMQGQRAFEEIRRKYRSDREFMQTVDRYIAEFERLLDEVSRDDRGQMVARTYLTSETGKVYTMLAHAAGRFDQ